MWDEMGEGARKAMGAAASRKRKLKRITLKIPKGRFSRGWQNSRIEKDAVK
jgi:hypothetical protein